MSPSSLARSSSHRLLPSERQKADEQRLRERRRKLIDRGRPGPTDYTPQVDEKGFEADMSTRKGAETMQNAVFVSKTKKPEPNQIGFVEHYNDPGSYNPAENQKIAHRTKAESTFSTTMQNGHGGFGTLQSRTLVIPADLNGEALPTAIGGHKGIKETANSVETGMAETPGPAAYTPQLTEVGKEFDMSVMQGAETMPMAVFQSKVARIGDILPKATASNPGPGTYNPNEKMVINHLPGANPNSNLVSKVGRDTHFAGDVIDDVGVMTGPNVGPGSYSARNWGESIAEDQVKRGSLTSRLMIAAKPALDAIGFGAKYRARELPHEQFHGVASKAEATPGPGAYTPQVDEKGSEDAMATRKGAETMQNAVFVSKTKKPEPNQIGFVEHYNDPGSYNPAENQKIAHRTKAESTFSTTMQNGHGGFGTLQSRTLVIPADLNGEALPTAIGGHKGIKETANSVETGMAETPGPAAYTPQLTEVGKEFDMSVMQGAETMPMAVFQSKVARIGDILPKATASNPGPGTYNPNEKMVINHLPGANPNSNLVSKVGRDSAFAGESIDDVGMMTGPDVGPGSYDPMRTIDGERNTVVGRVAVRSQNNEDASFVSTQDRNIFEWMLNEFGNFGVQRPPS